MSDPRRRTAVSEKARLLGQIRALLGFFVAALVVSGLTAFPLCSELRLLNAWFGEGTWAAGLFPALAGWLSLVQEGLEFSYSRYPFLAYGTDWLAFAHLVIAVALWGPIRNPVKNIWVVEFGMIACLMVIPLALICGSLRDIPFGWRLLDCGFGVFGILPLLLVHRMIRRLEKLG